MDVTSLLNANAAEQQKKGDGAKTTPTRNRTPWDAGGYSLPINTISSIPMTTKTTTTSSSSSSSSTIRTPTPPQNGQQDAQEQEQSQEMPCSPRHKFSDSRSSLSSFTSSLQSASHSRFSSLSTVGSLHQVNSISETLSGAKTQPSDFSILNNAEISRPSTSGGQHRGSVSPTASMEALVLAAEKHSVSQRPSVSCNQSIDDSNLAQAGNPSGSSRAKGVSLHRPSSPSDAILIKRTMVPTLRVNTGDHDLKVSDDLDLKSNYLSAPLEHHANSLINTRSHKRALSAPGFSAVLNHHFTMSEISNSSNLGPRPDPTPPHSNHPDNDSPVSPMDSAYPAPDTPPANGTDASESTKLVCMFPTPPEQCTTGSQLRKAISHIFGRNKMCTRLIPDEVWVHYCRKHYQRSRYRDPKRYANVQSRLVLQQIWQIEQWSNANQANGKPGVVESWGLAVRKREQKRLDDLTTNLKRKASTLDDEADLAGGSSAPHSAVPEWLLQLTGKGYSTQEIQDIARSLHKQITENEALSFPDIEILPNIIVNQDEPKSPKGYAKRHSSVSSGPGHKRAQSLGAAMKSDYYTTRRLSQPVAWAQDPSHPNMAYASPIQKRRRGNDLSEANSPILPFRNHLVERPLESGRRMNPYNQQNMYNIDEHQASNDRFINQAPLPAPTPQRMGGQTMAAHLEHNQFAHVRRPVHQRSQSDMSGFPHSRVGYQATPSSVYSSDVIGRSSFYEQPQAANRQYSPQQQHRWEPSVPQQSMHHGYQQRSMSQHHSGLAGSAHHRNQSMPMAVSAYTAPQQFNTSSSYGTLPSVPHIVEAQQARDMYSSRR